jgi:hypothetical protein
MPWQVESDLAVMMKSSTFQRIMISLVWFGLVWFGLVWFGCSTCMINEWWDKTKVPSDDAMDMDIP